MLDTKQLEKMSLTELKTLKSMVQSFIDSKIGDTVIHLKVGDTVKINHRKTKGLKFQVLKINRKRCKVLDLTSKVTYNCDFGLIEKI